MATPVSTPGASHRRTKHARTALLCGLAAAVGLQLALALAADLRCPAIYDPEFYRRLNLLRARQQERPGLPLALLMGSSRTVGSFRPEILSPLHAVDGREVLVFNASHIANDPVALMLEYRRLRQAGIRPDYLVLEVLPALLTIPQPALAADIQTIREAPVLCRYYNPLEVGWRYTRRRLNWCRNYGHELVNSAVPILAGPGEESNWDRLKLGALGGSCLGPGLHDGAAPDEVRRLVENAKKVYRPRLGDFALADNQVRAFDAILTSARGHGIPTVLIATPESSEYRGWYSQAAEETLAQFLKERHARHGATIVNARCWLPDDEFIDGHHVLLSGAD
ncbi:MAG TPA: hypothetical protein VHR72_02625, partial [Gemmataceae bacterium]|nr:hypothetical protein [Gemmataceae bacterium]